MYLTIIYVGMYYKILLDKYDCFWLNGGWNEIFLSFYLASAGRDEYKA